jgi:DNA-binding CsgD family transcriptional regulator
MARAIDSGSEAALVAKLAEALGSSLDMRVVLKRSFPLLRRLVPADYAALAVAGSLAPQGFEWMVMDMPSRFFESYPAMATHDFVHRAAVARPNRVVRDQDIIRRSELEQNVLYRHGQQIGVPLEQVMAVMLHVDERWQSGLSLYRARRRPFSGRERAALQRITPALANAIRNCDRFAHCEDWHAALEAWLEQGGRAFLIVSASGVELARSSRATVLVERWFLPHERRGTAWRELLATLLESATTGSRASLKWRARSDGTTLAARCYALPQGLGRRAFGVLLDERIKIPRAWRSLLTPKESEVLAGAVDGWDNRLIGEVLCCAEGTVKKHMRRIFDKLGVDSRSALAARAADALRED